MLVPAHVQLVAAHLGGRYEADRPRDVDALRARELLLLLVGLQRVADCEARLAGRHDLEPIVPAADPSALGDERALAVDDRRGVAEARALDLRP